MTLSFVKQSFSLLFVSILVFMTGCSSTVSGGYGNQYGHHSGVSVHGHGSGAGVLGALIVGGIIGTMIAEVNNDDEKQELENQEHGESSEPQQSSSVSQDELVNGYSLNQPQSNNQTNVQYSNSSGTDGAISDYQHQQSDIQWYQIGKDGHCYLMGIDKGVTDVIASVSDEACEPK